MPHKVTTCCYCGTRAALVLSGTTRHELACGSCGAPLHVIKKLRSDSKTGQERREAPVQAVHHTKPVKQKHKKKQKQFQKIEEQVNKLQEEKSKIEEQLAKPEFYADKEKFLKLDVEYKALTQEIEIQTKEYNKLFEELIHLEQQIG